MPGAYKKVAHNSGIFIVNFEHISHLVIFVYDEMLFKLVTLVSRRVG